MIRVAASEVSPPASTKVEVRSKGEGDEQGCADGRRVRTDRRRTKMGKVLAAAVPEYGTGRAFLIGGGNVNVWSQRMT